MTAGAAMKSTVYFKKSQRAVAIVLPGADEPGGRRSALTTIKTGTAPILTFMDRGT